MSESKKHEEFVLNETKCHLPEQVHNSLDSNNHSDTENNIFWEPKLRKKNSFSNPLLSIPPSTSNANCEIQDDSNERSSSFFKDGYRSIDYVLVWDKFQPRSLDKINVEKRQIFEDNLRGEGLDLEYENEVDGLNFIKIHAPLQVLRRYSEILKLRMPMKEIPEFQGVHDRTNSFFDKCNASIYSVLKHIYVDKKIFPRKSHRFTAVYSRDKEYLFDVNSPGFFTPAIHSRIVQFILDRQRFSLDDSNEFAFGIERLINENVYRAAYPLHDGDLNTPGSMRYTLFNEWGSIKRFYRYQPLDYVKDYFGVKIALYFAWLGFYTHMLVPASIVGLVCFIYSCCTIYQNQPSQDICENQLKIKMCPLCDFFCDYWDLSETCLHARVTYLIDNPSTVFFAIFMSFWAAMFLELWKRYSAEITHRWDLTGFDINEEHPRPEYLARLAHVEKKHVNVVTNTMEPYVPFWKVRFPATMLSFSIVLLLVAMAVAAVLGVVLYRMSLLAALSVYGDSVITSYAILFTTATAATINLFCIFIFNWIYSWLAECLTELEFLRTQTEFDDSLTLKIYLLQFVNYYASIFYIAFFKGKFIGYPGNYNRLFGYRQEECGPGGCLMELCIQLAIIMVGKQAANTILEMLFPLFFKWLNLRWLRTELRGKTSIKGAWQWLKDFKLIQWGPRGLFPEYLEMVLQYGFVTIFVAAFPLAPFFALINNVFEMRLDAKKLLTFYRRPVTQRVRDIGVWFKILNSIGRLAIITNGFIIAFTSEFIPRLVYVLHVNVNKSLDGYLNHSLSYFDVTEFPKESAPQNTVYNISYCRYPDYRQGPWQEKPYSTTSTYWHVLAARLAFVVVFENAVVLVILLVQWCVPSIPGYLKDKIRREAFITSEIIIKQETERARRAGLTPTLKRSSKGAGDVLSGPEGALETLIASENNLVASSLQINCARVPQDVPLVSQL
ncbi:transmembrane protein 16E, putative [Pediculus humanus corporis]|uniref:Anoctamin n=1 Tax=Pediculus humanus subsp. corporis TaxID=121224 RepID=E0VLJ2_PEDHC|nr:transmembrane protein 16E, putative [Pediculus humanus corporis]EEB14248.1 transmembrane protein 16E, putative [Pediculus humanus corporis]